MLHHRTHIFILAIILGALTASVCAAEFDPEKMESVATHAVQAMTTGATIGRLFAHPDGKRLIASCKDSSARVWDIKTKKQLQLLEHGDSTWALALHPDGKRLLTGGNDDALTLWNLDTGEELQTYNLTDRVFDAAFDPDGKRFASSDDDETLTVRVVETGEVLHTLKGHKKDIYAVRFLDKDTIFSGGDGGEAIIWDLSKPEKIVSNSFNLGASDVYSLDLHPTEKLISVALEKNQVRVLNHKGEEQWRIDAPGAVRTTSWSPDGKRMAITTSSGNMAMYEKTNQLWLVEHQSGKNETWSVEFATDGKSLFAADGNQVHYFSAKDGSRIVNENEARRNPVSPWSLSSKQGSLVVRDTRGAHTLDLKAGTYGAFADAEKADIKFLARAPGGARYAVADRNTIDIHDSKTRKRITTLPRSSSTIDGLTFLDKKRIAYSTSADKISCWEVSGATPKELWESKCTGLYKLGPAIAGGMRLCVGIRDSSKSKAFLVIFNTESGEELQRLPMAQDYVRTIGSAHGTVIIFVEDSSDKNRTLYLWRTASGGEPLKEAEVIRQIKNLGANSYKERVAAVKAFSAGGPREADRIRPLLESDDPEISYRAEQALARIAANGNLEETPLVLPLKEDITRLRPHPDGIHWYGIQGTGIRAGVVIGRIGKEKLEIVRTLRDGHGAACISLSKDGQTFTVANQDGSVSIWTQK